MIFVPKRIVALYLKAEKGKKTMDMQHRGTELQVKEKNPTKIDVGSNETSKLMEELKELFCREQKNKLPLQAYFDFPPTHLTCKTLAYHHLYYHLPVFLGVFFLVALKRRIGSKLGVEPRQDEERILYPLTSSIFYFMI